MLHTSQSVYDLCLRSRFGRWLAGGASCVVNSTPSEDTPLCPVCSVSVSSSAGLNGRFIPEETEREKDTEKKLCVIGGPERSCVKQ